MNTFGIHFYKKIKHTVVVGSIYILEYLYHSIKNHWHTIQIKEVYSLER